MVRAYILFFLCSLSMNYVSAQVDTSRLFYAKNLESAAFVEFGSRINQTNGTAGMDVDFSVNWLVNHKYYLGAAYSQLASVEKTYSSDTVGATIDYKIETQIKYQTLGLRVGYILFDDQKIVSFSPDITLGWVGAKLITGDNKQTINGAYISPALKGVFNVSDYFRIGVSLNYNLFVFKAYDSLNIDGSEYYSQLQPKDINGIGGGIFLRVGRF